MIGERSKIKRGEKDLIPRDQETPKKEVETKNTENPLQNEENLINLLQR